MTTSGNLFADGFNSNRAGFALVELPNGGNKFCTITTSNTVRFPGSVQWDGTYLTVLDQNVDAIYRYTVSGTKATLKGTVTHGFRRLRAVLDRRRPCLLRGCG